MESVSHSIPNSDSEKQTGETAKARRLLVRKWSISDILYVRTISDTSDVCDIKDTCNINDISNIQVSSTGKEYHQDLCNCSCVIATTKFTVPLQSKSLSSTA